MRNGQNKRMRGRNRKSHNPLTRVYESNGPDVKIRGTASHIAEKYMQLARDAQASGDPVSAENYFQHAEHYLRLIAAAQEQFRQTPGFFRNEGGAGDRDDLFDEGDDEPGMPTAAQGEQPAFGTRDPQPYLPRDAQFFVPREQAYVRQPQPQPAQSDDDIGRLPSFVTGAPAPAQQAAPAFAQNGAAAAAAADGEAGQNGDRFPLHRRRRRHRTTTRGEGAEGGEEMAAPAPGPATE
ncbi:hypothetical protein A33M_1510 [Rhodovulum sp. PH10]|uniref:DUF4167 domain-containing protein n=1 Tax=Rhodovulum sp. PH10 TaxID=1187851 RepID=UPI00027C1FD0|nr:DUF4167 domain-containing protein [Rhodovulum sp. PH10]EJW12948.1 hypothetical protein A33M_1510 [Rhodovulum sp. PH10]